MLFDFTKQKFDIILQAGQSNAEGCGFGAVENPFVPDNRIWYLKDCSPVSTSVKWQKPLDLRVASEPSAVNFATSFAELYSERFLKPERKLLIVRAAVSGTGFLDGRWGMENDLHKRMLQMTEKALSLNPDNRLAAFLWHQGESDAGMNASYDTHYKNLLTLVESVKTAFDYKSLPFIAGDFVQDWKSSNLSICEPVAAAIRAVCRDVGGAFAETDGLASNAEEYSRRKDSALPNLRSGPGPREGERMKDTIHFSRAALMELGRRYFNKYVIDKP